jgi:ligand-binding SRPBCC domain-containing protein
MQLVESVLIKCPPEKAFRFCLSLSGFQRHFPLPTRWLDGPSEWSRGTVVHFRFRKFGLWLRYLAEITEVQENELFVDVMRRGPYKFRTHRHVFRRTSEGVLYSDEIDFSGGLGGAVDRYLLGRMERATLRQRQRRLKAVLEAD